MHCMYADGDRCRIRSKDSNQCCRNTPAENQPEKHDRESHYEGGHKNILYTPVFFRTIVVADKRPDSLNDTVDRKIDKGLQLVVSAEHENIGFAEGRENSVER